MKYKVGDSIELTRDLYIPMGDFNMFELKKENIGTIISVDIDSYIVDAFVATLRIGIDLLEATSELHVYKTVNTNAKRYSKVVKEGLTFGEAIDRVMHHRQKATRAIWGGYWERQILTGKESWKNEFIVAALKDGGYAVATPYQDDMFATDWMIVE